MACLFLHSIPSLFCWQGLESIEIGATLVRILKEIIDHCDVITLLKYSVVAARDGHIVVDGFRVEVKKSVIPS